MPANIVQDVNFLYYRERLGLSYREMLEEPVEEINRAMLIWSLESHRDKLRAKREQ